MTKVAMGGWVAAAVKLAKAEQASKVAIRCHRLGNGKAAQNGEGNQQMKPFWPVGRQSNVVASMADCIGVGEARRAGEAE